MNNILGIALGLILFGIMLWAIKDDTTYEI